MISKHPPHWLRVSGTNHILCFSPELPRLEPSFVGAAAAAAVAALRIIEEEEERTAKIRLMQS